LDDARFSSKLATSSCPFAIAMPVVTLTPVEWATLEQLLDAVLDKPESERACFLASRELPPAMREELHRWLAAESESRGFLADAIPTELLAVGELLGHWRVLALIGRGGSGEVYRVERADGSYEQQAALKLLARPEEPDDLRRFAAERRLLARLEHPDIARLLDGGVHQGRPYAVLELIEGERLDAHARRLPLAARLALFLRICSAVAHAHRHLVVHRDLKPANVLVTAEGAPKLLDFGIAKPVDAGNAQATLALRLTPDYCAPEQLAGEVVTPAADVFALGVMLHEILTGRAPWRLAGAGVQRALSEYGYGNLKITGTMSGETQAAIQSGANVLFEAAVQHDGVLIRADVLERVATRRGRLEDLGELGGVPGGELRGAVVGDRERRRRRPGITPMHRPTRDAGEFFIGVSGRDVNRNDRGNGEKSK